MSTITSWDLHLITDDGASTYRGITSKELLARFDELSPGDLVSFGPADQSITENEEQQP